MTHRRKLLMETLAGHFAWLQSAHPRKANTRLARGARRRVEQTLRILHRKQTPA